MHHALDRGHLHPRIFVGGHVTDLLDVVDLGNER